MKLSKKAYLCPVTPYIIIGNIQKNILRKQIYSLIPSYNTFKVINPQQENKFYIIHPSAKNPNKLQATFFYNNIPYSDIIRDNMEQIINELSLMGFIKVKEAI